MDLVLCLSREPEVPSQRKEREAAGAAAASLEDACKKARHDTFADLLREDQALDLARLRFLLLIEAAHVDRFKVCVQNWMLKTKRECASRIDQLFEQKLDPLMLKVGIHKAIADATLWFDGLETEKRELAYLRSAIPIVEPHERELVKESIHLSDGSEDDSSEDDSSEDDSSEDVTDVLEGLPKAQAAPTRMAYDFLITDLLVRLMEGSATAREQMYDWVEKWATADPIDLQDPCRIIADIDAGKVFNDNVAFNQAAREAYNSSRGNKVKTMKVACIISADGFVPINQLSGVAQEHGIWAVSISILSLEPSLRMALMAIQPVTLCLEKHVKAVGMVNVVNGGETSLGAQLRGLHTPGPRTTIFPLRNRCYLLHACYAPVSLHACYAPPAHHTHPCYTGMALGVRTIISMCMLSVHPQIFRRWQQCYRRKVRCRLTRTTGTPT